MKLQKEPLKAFLEPGRIEAGCDEAGRGCYAGPVCAAAVILPENYSHPLLNDSKKLSDKQRRVLRETIIVDAIDYAVAMVDHQEIDQINILNASILAMHRALAKLKTVPDFILADGNKFKPFLSIPHSCVIKGDGKFFSIAAASILAKTARDDFMLDLHNEYPVYNWDKNKGYPTAAHRKAILKYGISPYHRKSYHMPGMEPELPFPDL
ncbi:MAG: ribonuclease HII [Salinivirgaceae bacterium]